MDAKLLVLVLCLAFTDCTSATTHYCSSSQSCDPGYVCCNNYCVYGSSCVGQSCYVASRDCLTTESCCSNTCQATSSCYEQSCIYDVDCNGDGLSCCDGSCHYYCDYFLGVGVIVTIICGAIIFVSLVVFVVIICVRRRRLARGNVVRNRQAVATTIDYQNYGQHPYYPPLQGQQYYQQPPPQYGATGQQVFPPPYEVRVVDK